MLTWKFDRETTDGANLYFAEFEGFSCQLTEYEDTWTWMIFHTYGTQFIGHGKTEKRIQAEDVVEARAKEAFVAACEAPQGTITLELERQLREIAKNLQWRQVGGKLPETEEHFTAEYESHTLTLRTFGVSWMWKISLDETVFGAGGSATREHATLSLLMEMSK